MPIILTRTIALHLAWFPALFIAWLMIAAKSASPVPYNWPQLSRIADILVVSLQASMLLFMVAPVAWFAASRASRWALVYPVLLFVDCGATVALSLRQLALMPPEPAYVAPYRSHRCTRPSGNMPAVDALGKPIQHGDLVLLRATPGADGPMPDTPKQAFQREAWDDRTVVVTGFVKGGALRVVPTDEDMVRDEPHFCVWPDKVFVHAHR